MENCSKGLKYALSGCMEIHPCVLQDISSLGPLPCSHSTSSANHSKQGIGYRWPCAILGWLVILMIDRPVLISVFAWIGKPTNERFCTMVGVFFAEKNHPYTLISATWGNLSIQVIAIFFIHHLMFRSIYKINFDAPTKSPCKSDLQHEIWLKLSSLNYCITFGSSWHSSLLVGRLVMFCF